MCVFFFFLAETPLPAMDASEHEINKQYTQQFSKHTPSFKRRDTDLLNKSQANSSQKKILLQAVLSSNIVFFTNAGSLFHGVYYLFLRVLMDH